MPDPAVVVLMRQHKADLLGQEQVQMREMASRWLQVERRLDGQMQLLAYEMDSIKRSGGTVSREMLMTQVRYRELLVQLQGELGNYTGYVDRTITDRQRQLARLGVAQAQQAIATQGMIKFNRLPVEAVEHVVGLAGNGAPVRVLLEQSWPLAAEGMAKELIKGVALGYNPRKTARNMAAGATGSLDRMMTVARSEQLRVYRFASIESYKASGVVTSYYRLSARDDRVCEGCLAADGEELGLDQYFDSHPNCRCVPIPKVEGIPLEFQTGAEWFEEQPATVQRDILGPGKYALWAKGEIANFKDFATVVPNAVWGDAIVPTPLKDLAA